MPTIELEQFYAADAATLWLALTDPDALSAWLLPTDDFAPRVGTAVSFRGRPKLGFDGTVHGEVVEAEAPTRLAYTWHGAGVATLVELTVTARPGRGTHLRLRQSGFEGLRGHVVARLLRGGWRHRLDDRLRATTELLGHLDPSALDPESVATAAGDREEDLDVHGMLRRMLRR